METFVAMIQVKQDQTAVSSCQYTQMSPHPPQAAAVPPPHPQVQPRSVGMSPAPSHSSLHSHPGKHTIFFICF